MKIRNDQIKIGNEYFNIEIHYDKKGSRFFVKGIPDDFIIYSDTWKKYLNHFPTENVLMSTLNASKLEYTEHKQTSKKVIVFSCVASYEIIMNKEGDRSYSGFKKPNLKKMCDMGYHSLKRYHLGFEFDVMTQIESCGESKFYRHILDENGFETISTHGQSFNRKSISIIPYSYDSLMFFKNMAKQFENMAHKLGDFFGEEDEEKILSIINRQSGLNLLT